MSLTHKALSRWTCGLDFGFAITLFGYQVGLSFDLTEWHLMAEHHEGLGYLLCVGPIALDILDATQYTPLADPELQRLQDAVFDAEKETAKYYVELEETKQALEQETVRLAACSSTIAGTMGELEVVDYAFSPPQDSAYRLVTKYNQALKEIEKLRKKLGVGGKNVKSKSLSTGKSSRKS